MRTYVYCRVSTGSQTTDNQVLEIQRAGYDVDTVFSDSISGKVPASERPKFRDLLEAIRLDPGPKRLVVSKLDRLGRDAGDIHRTVATLSDLGCAVKVLQLGDADLTNGAGKIILATLAAVAEVERDMIKERINSGLQRAKAEGKQLGRRKDEVWYYADEIRELLSERVSVSEVARRYNTTRTTIQRIRAAG